jgi:hypothetical protein
MDRKAGVMRGFFVALAVPVGVPVAMIRIALSVPGFALPAFDGHGSL